MRKYLTPFRTPLLALLAAVSTVSATTNALATSGAELLTTESYSYGRFEARVQFAGGDGVVSSFFLWKSGSEMSDIYWNELDLETIWADCELKTNALYGLPEANHTASSGTDGGWCTGFHTYAFEWTPDYVAWFADGKELRRETGADSTAFRDNASEQGMQFHFNVWPGDATFGGNFSETILPIHQYINWVQYTPYKDGAFASEPDWREDFSGSTLPEGWDVGTWPSPKNKSTHEPLNVTFKGGYAILSLTKDDAMGNAGANPLDPDGPGPVDDPGSGSGGSGGLDGVGGGNPAGGGGDVPVPGAGGGGDPGVPGAGGADAGPGAGGLTGAGAEGNVPGAGGNATDPSGAGGDANAPGGPGAPVQSSGGGCAVGSGSQSAWGGFTLMLSMAAVGWFRRRHSRRESARSAA
jgi:endo-1,3-1,4-beta-glycanase ExoK